MQYLCVRHTERLAEAGAGPQTRPRKTLDDVEYATLEWVDWFNHRRLLETIGYIPPAELEEMFYREEAPAEEARLKRLSLH